MVVLFDDQLPMILQTADGGAGHIPLHLSGGSLAPTYHPHSVTAMRQSSVRCCGLGLPAASASITGSSDR